MSCFNPLDKFYKSKKGAIEENSILILRVKGNFDFVNFMCQKDGENCFISHNMTKKNDYFELQITFNKGLYFYYFDCGNGNFIGKNDSMEGVITSNPNPFQLTAYKSDYCVPDWIYGGVIYQIFPDRFYRSDANKVVPEYKVLHENWNDLPTFLPNEQGEILNNDFFGGDLKGIAEKLDYVKSLGVNVIYLNPVFKAYSNHRYDTGDYMQIDPLLGDVNDFKHLLQLAKEKGIKIVLDGVFNHTGDDSVYFNRYNRYGSLGAYQSKDSPYYEWFNFTDYPNKYDSWWGIKTLPAINEENSSFIQFVTGKGGVIDYYTNMGVSGWRLDVVDELPSAFVKNVRKAVKNSNNQAIIIGEVWEDASNKISYDKRREYLQGEELDSAMNYPLKNAILSFVNYGDEQCLSLTIKEQLDHYPHIALHAMMNLLSTHDTARLITVLDDNYPIKGTKEELAKYSIPKENLDNAIFKLRVATLLQFTLCGVPSIYYGDEVGMQGAFDPLNRRTFPWQDINTDLLDWYKFLSKLRAEYSAFKCGDFEEIYKKHGVYLYKRYDDDSQVLICTNLSNEDIYLNFEGQLTEIITQQDYCDNYILKNKSIAILVNNN